jgi:branched-chain amino acid transport system substrate-binding protein
VKQFLFRPLIAALIGAMIIGRLVTGVIGPDQYKVYLVGPFDRQSDAAGEMWKKLASSPVGKLDGVQVSFDKENDHGDETTAIRIAENLARRANTLMVIGHLVSTQTRAALPAYLQSVTPAIPVILTTETNPRLVPPSGRSDGFVPIFRLSPTDEDQAEVAAAFVIKKGGKAVWVAESGENPVYSEFLATRFIDQIQKKSDGKCRTVLWSRKFDNQLADAIDKFGIDWVFFLGDWRTGLVLARQISSMKKSEAVSVLLSDSAMDKDLAKSADHDARNIYLMFPLAAKTFEGGYGVYASDAASVISSLIAEANRDFQRYAKEGNERRWRLHRLLGLKRVADARNAIGNVMKAAELRSDTLPLDLTDLPRAQFCAGGLVKGRSFDVWQVTQGKFLPANGLRSNAPDDRCPDPGSG